MKDLTNLKTFIIDTKNPQEIDDAISLELKNDTKIIWIHISYPASLFEFNSKIDLEARKKSSSLYLVDDYIPMLPKNIIEECNLKENKKSKVLSIGVELNNNGSVKNYKLLETLIKPNYELTYEDANELIELEPPEEYELIILNNLLKKRFNYRKKHGAIIFSTTTTKINYENNNVYLEKFDITEAHKLITEAMLLTGFIMSDYLKINKIASPYRSQKLNCNPEDILKKYSNSPVKYIILKQFIGKSYISTKASAHETLGLDSYVQCTSPMRRYLDLVIQKQIYLHINKKEVLSEEFIQQQIELDNKKQKENNNILKDNKLIFLKKFFKDYNKNYFKIIFIRWINHKKNIALVYFPDLYLEQLIILYISIDTYQNKTYKVKFNPNENLNLLEFIN